MKQTTGGTTKGGRGRLHVGIQSSLERIAVVPATYELDDFKFYIKSSLNSWSLFIFITH
jgi:hypothetical protein